MAMLLLVLNVLVLAVAGVFLYAGDYLGPGFFLGALVASILYNLAHRVIYGRWL